MRLTEIRFHTRDIGYGTEDGIADAYVTDEVDTWGKRTVFLSLNGADFQPWYLFDDEWEEA